MLFPSQNRMSASELRRELAVRNLRMAGTPHEVTFGRVPSVIYGTGEEGRHGNFLAASHRRIVADGAWRRRLEKGYTASARVARSGDRRRFELDCANSSDALLMNVFCYPGLLRRVGVCRLLGVEVGERPEFGYRARVPYAAGGTDRTEVDMRLGACLFEAKLTETCFQRARAELVERYRGFNEVFDREELPRRGAEYDGYQLIRGVLAVALEDEGRFTVLADARRVDLRERWFGVMRAVRGAGLRSRLALVTWQEVAAESPAGLRGFLQGKYGIGGGQG